MKSIIFHINEICEKFVYAEIYFHEKNISERRISGKFLRYGRWWCVMRPDLSVMKSDAFWKKLVLNILKK